MAQPSIASQTYLQIPYYAQDVDFDDLAKRDPDWASISRSAKGTKWIDFKDSKVVLQLTQSLLKCDFGLTIELPHDRLCPPVPVRWNYVRWIQDLLDTTSDSYSDRYDPERDVVGLDIGVGASAIYPLLACSTRPQWRMVGTDIDQHSLDYARKNVESNRLAKRIKLVTSNSSDSLIPVDTLGIDELDFVMANPPFYSSRADMENSYGAKTAAPSAICTGSGDEMTCPGGDVGFVSRIIEESLVLRDKVQWYTAMLGKLSSLQQIVAKLKVYHVTNFATTCLQAGHKTKRWAVGWSFHDLRPRNDIARHGEQLAHAVLPHPTAQTIAVPSMNAVQSGERVDTMLKALDVTWQWRPAIAAGVMEAKENTWSRAARRKKMFGAKRDDNAESREHVSVAHREREDEDDSETDDYAALAVKMICSHEKVDIRWLRGIDHVIWESFCGFLKRALTTQE